MTATTNSTASSADPAATTANATANVQPPETKIPHHWNFFLALDDDVMRLSRYIEPAEENFGTYSLELARVLAAAASEVDVVAKQLCLKLNSTSTADRMNVYREEITTAYPGIGHAYVYIPKFGLTLKPWLSWMQKESPAWWKAHTNVKHQRHQHFSDASLKNTLDAIAGLFVLLLYFYPKEARTGQLSPDPSLFRAGAPFHTDALAWRPHVTVYSLDLRDLVAHQL